MSFEVFPGSAILLSTDVVPLHTFRDQRSKFGQSLSILNLCRRTQPSVRGASGSHVN